MKLAQLGEFGLIEEIRRAAETAGLPRVALGIGDDCAALDVAAGELVLTSTDLLIENVHFRRAWTDMTTLGRKSVNVNVSDIAAMGGRPLAVYLGLGIPAGMSVEALRAFAAGVIDACAKHGLALAGGDTCRSDGGLFISITAQGAVPREQLVSRGGARAGDQLWVSGTLGDSALALRELLAGRQPAHALARRHHDPSARVALGRALAAAELATAMIDVSDGLLADLGHILAASGVGARLETARLPLSAPFREALATDPQAIELALTGGEDYELLFTARPEHQAAIERLDEAGVAVTLIGRIVPKNDGLAVLDGSGRALDLPARGFNHFSREESGSRAS